MWLWGAISLANCGPRDRSRPCSVVVRYRVWIFESMQITDKSVLAFRRQSSRQRLVMPDASSGNFVNWFPTMKNVWSIFIFPISSGSSVIMLNEILRSRRLSSWVTTMGKVLNLLFEMSSSRSWRSLGKCHGSFSRGLFWREREWRPVRRSRHASSRSLIQFEER